MTMDPAVTLITGTRKGIGRGLAEHYVRAGHEVIGCSRADVDWTLERYAHYRVDVTDERAVKISSPGFLTEAGRNRETGEY